MDTLINILQGVGTDTIIDMTKSVKMNNNTYTIADKANSDKKGTNQQPKVLAYFLTKKSPYN